MSQSFAYSDTDALLGKIVQNYSGSLPAAVPASETTIVTHTATKDEIVKYVYAGGETDGKFVLYIGATPFWTARNAWTQRNIDAMVEKKLVSGDVIALKVTNLKTTNHFFSGGFTIYEL